jgi:hypothetical protein
MFQWAAAAVVTMYVIRYLRASNSTIASLYPNSATTTTTGATA